MLPARIQCVCELFTQLGRPWVQEGLCALPVSSVEACTQQGALDESI
ncbi:MAG: hypothetical protein JKY65_20605 [Planctomycetes bacterium]|nr:hypothetical protein [Planctomycetota bacterium]